ncbi:hypothetical protein TCAL_15371 [Tigriopus californicus]|uniref:Reverse transcriptase domain-containing protein n=1 Tax=Tigriopus californicus TaxID=6832 RepID=A0A553PKP8_TIGCA|nr:hypothetical protein TCAL_15371 [Tigriopus californicus]
MALGILSLGFPTPAQQDTTVATILTTDIDNLEVIKSDFADVLCDSLGTASGCIEGEPMKIVLDPTAEVKLIQVRTARPVPFNMLEITDGAVADLVWLLKIVDDMLVQAPTEQILYKRLRIVLARCREAGIKLSIDKLVEGVYKIRWFRFPLKLWKTRQAHFCKGIPSASISE